MYGAWESNLGHQVWSKHLIFTHWANSPGSWNCVLNAIRYHALGFWLCVHACVDKSLTSISFYIALLSTFFPFKKWDRVLCVSSWLQMYYMRMALNSLFYCLHLVSADIRGMCHHLWFYMLLSLKPGTQGFMQWCKHSISWATPPSCLLFLRQVFHWTCNCSRNPSVSSPAALKLKALITMLTLTVPVTQSKILRLAQSILYWAIFPAPPYIF